MTAYHGGKQKIGLKVAEAIHDYVDSHDALGEIKGYCEPFCGMLGVYQHIPELLDSYDFSYDFSYRAGDVNKSVVLMWKRAQKGWKPDTIGEMTRERFDKLKYDQKYSAIKGFVGHVYTFRGVFFDGFFKHSSQKIQHNAQNVARIAKKLRNVEFSHGTYTQFSRLKNNIIYCDPPYANGNQRYYTGKEYKNRLEFDSEKFWDWVRKMSVHNYVFVSEYKAPKDFKSIWKQEGGVLHKQEHLFVLRT